MPSLLLTVFLLQLVIHLINTVGANSINELLWTLYNKLPTPTRNAVRESRILRAEVVRLRKEMNATSSQDEFAKWAKLRRSHDKAVAKYDENGMPFLTATTSQPPKQHLPPHPSTPITNILLSSANSLKSTRSTFDRTTTLLRWVGTNGLRLLIQFYYAKTPMFWIPRDWVPNYVAFLLAFPRAPRGSVSVQIWGIACATVVQMVFAAGAAGWVLVNRERVEGKGRGKEGLGVKMGAEVEGRKVKGQGKKEL
ncbi:MAG: hypothetical protein Q9166_002186 [cf. Caloplaca sp. 2 TL-2023]